MQAIGEPILVTPGVEPVTLPELKLHCRVDHEEEDTLITSLGKAARQWFENALDRQLTTATWRIKVGGFNWTALTLPYPPLVAVTAITYLDAAGDSHTLDAAVYDVVTSQTPGYVRLANEQSWPATLYDPEAVTITYTAGYGDVSAVPDLVKAGIKILVGHWFKNREAVAAGTMNEVPMALDSIVASVRAYRF